MWTHTKWQNVFFAAGTSTKDHLENYSNFYTSVEGNTTFYALPKLETVQNWADSTADNFKFCFKLPQKITHELQLINCQSEVDSFLNLLGPIIATGKLATIQIQLPPYFSANQLVSLSKFLELNSRKVNFSVEVRHLDFFNKQQEEKDLNQLLIQYQVDRIMMDTRPVHSQVPSTEAIKDAQLKKPKVPVHVLSTANQPIVRYVGQTNIEANRAFIQPWLKHFKLWLEQGKKPYLFIHTADNAYLHDLTRLWLSMLEQSLGYYPAHNTLFPVEKAKLEANQASLF
ncbi:DUF72 domain-containing protein [Catenovulum maritimum]|uniref:DUF72 domain-containing protein n=1 Tax=Catenovulum maritimum TaxID=1513271 RepID=A0A0J8JNN7_9ALTE|nr:DUF72 domain-containing protein [Catenovulum maritimum]KMT66236.1 hypothetical protein XM47_04365 [Catenovulum maritimum]